MKLIKQVTEFHEKFGHLVEDKPKLPALLILVLRHKMIQEELDEYKEAYEEGDLVKMADALGDMMYLVVGGAIEIGIGSKMEEIMDEIQASNMSKLGADGKPIYREDGKVMKGPNYFPPNLKSILEK